MKRTTTIVQNATTPTPFKSSTQVAAFGRHHRGAAFVRVVPFVVSCVVALNTEDVVVFNTTCVLRVIETGYKHLDRKDARTDFRRTRT